MGYRILKKLIETKRKTKDELLDMAEVYHNAGKLTDEEYVELMERILGE